MDTTYLKYIEKKYGKDFAKGKKYVILLEDKHGSDMYLVASIEQLCLTSINILTDRFKQNCYYDPKDEEPEKPSISLEQVDSLPEGKVKNAGKDELRDYKIAYNSWKNAVGDYQELLKTIEDKNGAAAFVFLENRNDYEYESFRLEHLHEVK